MNVLDRCLVSTVIASLLTSCASAELRSLDGTVLDSIKHGSVITLWPKGTADVHPDIPEKSKPCGKRFFNIHNPNITVYKPRKANGVAVVLCPGGGYNYVAAGVEGVPVAEKLNTEGITVFVLKYRLPKTPGVDFKHPVPLSDALRAMQLVRHHAAEFGVSPEKIGIMGFSAGGHLASSAGTLFSKYDFGADRISKVSSRPDFMCLVYPVISTRQGIAHRCPQSLVRDKSDKQALAALSSELNVTARTPPAFLVHSKDDGGVKYQNSVVMHKALRKHGVPSEIKLYEKGGHGFGIGRKGADSTRWSEDFVAWLFQMKFISTTRDDNKPGADDRK